MDSKKIFTNYIVVLFGALICCVLWGSAFPGIKLGYEALKIASDDTASQILFGGYRFMLAGVLAVIIGSILQRRLIVPKSKEWKKVASLSLYQTIGQYILFYIGLAHTSGVRSSIVEGTNVFVAILVASLIFKQEKLTSRKIIGSAIGFAGVVIISVAGKSLGAGSLLTGDLLVFMSTFCYAFSSVMLKRYSVDTNPVMLSGYQFIFGGFVMTLVGLLFGGGFGVVAVKGIAILIYLAFVSAVAYSLWGVLLKYNPISRVAVIGFTNPVFGVVLSTILLKEGTGFGVPGFLSLALICVGIFIVNYDKK